MVQKLRVNLPVSASYINYTKINFGKVRIHILLIIICIHGDAHKLEVLIPRAKQSIICANKNIDSLQKRPPLQIPRAALTLVDSSTIPLSHIHAPSPAAIDFSDSIPYLDRISAAGSRTSILFPWWNN